MSNQVRKDIVRRIRDEGAQACRDGKHPDASPYRGTMDEFQWKQGYQYEQAVRAAEDPPEDTALVEDAQSPSRSPRP